MKTWKPRLYCHVCIHKQYSSSIDWSNSSNLWAKDWIERSLVQQHVSQLSQSRMNNSRKPDTRSSFSGSYTFFSYHRMNGLFLPLMCVSLSCSDPTTPGSPAPDPSYKFCSKTIAITSILQHHSITTKTHCCEAPHVNISTQFQDVMNH